MRSGSSRGAAFMQAMDGGISSRTGRVFTDRSQGNNMQDMLMSNRDRPARLHYMAYSFRVLTPGDHVVCAVSGEKISLEDLRYWSIARQEAYASAEASAEAEMKARAGGGLR